MKDTAYRALAAYAPMRFIKRALALAFALVSHIPASHGGDINGPFEVHLSLYDWDGHEHVHQEELPINYASNYETRLLVSEDLGSSFDQGLAFIQVRSESNQDGPDARHLLESHLQVLTAIDPLYASGYAKAVLELNKAIFTAEDFFGYWSFAWARTDVGHSQLFDDSAFQCVNCAATNIVIKGDAFQAGIQEVRTSGYVSGNASFLLRSFLHAEDYALPANSEIILRDVVEKMQFNLYAAGAGTSQDNPIYPGENIQAVEWLFPNVPTDAWFDPPTSSAFIYEMVSQTLFDAILDFPAGLHAPVVVSAEGQTLGSFGPGDSLDFVAMLGHGVERFTVSAIDPPASTGDTPGFALKLSFNTQSADFRIRAVPEPTGCVLAGTGILVSSALWRRVSRTSAGH